MSEQISLTPELATQWLELALDEARAGRAEGGQPVGSVLMSPSGEVLGRGRNRFLQTGRILAHAEVEAFEDADLRESYEGCTTVTTAEPCWYCTGLIRHFEISRVVVGASANRGRIEWLRSLGREVHLLQDPEAESYLGVAGGGR